MGACARPKPALSRFNLHTNMEGEGVAAEKRRAQTDASSSTTPNPAHRPTRRVRHLGLLPSLSCPPSPSCSRSGTAARPRRLTAASRAIAWRDCPAPHRERHREDQPPSILLQKMKCFPYQTETTLNHWRYHTTQFFCCPLMNSCRYYLCILILVLYSYPTQIVWYGFKYTHWPPIGRP
jgi:hypothetical protein